MENWKKTFGIIWSGQLASILSSSVVGYAIIFWMSIETGSAEVLALAAIAGMLPQSLLGPVVGVYVDRWDRKRTMILADSFIAFCTLILAVLFWFDVAQMWHIYILLACRSVGSAFHSPSMQASVPLLAPEAQLTRVAGVNQIINSLSNIIGPALGAVLISFTGIGNILLLDVAGAIIACTSLLFVHIPNPVRSTLKPNLWREFREGFSAITAVPGMAWLFTLTILVLFFIMPVGVMFPLMTLQHFGGSTYDMSLIEIVWGGGALVGGAIMGARVYRINRIVLINLMNFIVGVSFTLSGMLSPGGLRPLRRALVHRGHRGRHLQRIVRGSRTDPHRRGCPGARDVALLQLRVASVGYRTARYGVPGRTGRAHHDLRHRRTGDLHARTHGFLHPLGHAARQAVKKRGAPDTGNRREVNPGQTTGRQQETVYPGITGASARQNTPGKQAARKTGRPENKKAVRKFAPLLLLPLWLRSSPYSRCK